MVVVIVVGDCVFLCQVQVGQGFVCVEEFYCGVGDQVGVVLVVGGGIGKQLEEVQCVVFVGEQGVGWIFQLEQYLVWFDLLVVFYLLGYQYLGIDLVEDFVDLGVVCDCCVFVGNYLGFGFVLWID